MPLLLLVWRKYLNLYQQPFDEENPFVWMKSLFNLENRSAKPVNMFIMGLQRFFTELLACWRYVTANQIRGLLGVYYPDIPRIRLLTDNLNTRSVSPMYKAFSLETTRRNALHIYLLINKTNY